MPEKTNISEKLIEIVERSSPSNVKNLIEIAQKELGIPQKELLNLVIELQNQGKINLINSKSSNFDLKKYLLSSESTWFWLVISISIATALAVFMISSEDYPYTMIRYILGTIFIMIIPGYSLIRALYPEKELESIERLALAVGVSIALVPFTGLLLNYTSWGIRLIPLTVSLTSITLFLSLIGILRGYRFKLHSSG